MEKLISRPFVLNGFGRMAPSETMCCPDKRVSFSSLDWCREFKPVDAIPRESVTLTECTFGRKTTQRQVSLSQKKFQSCDSKPKFTNQRSLNGRTTFFGQSDFQIAWFHHLICVLPGLVRGLRSLATCCRQEKASVLLLNSLGAKDYLPGKRPSLFSHYGQLQPLYG